MAASFDLLQARVVFALTDAYGADEANRLWAALTGGEIEARAWEIFLARISTADSAGWKESSEERRREYMDRARNLASEWVESRPK